MGRKSTCFLIGLLTLSIFLSSLGLLAAEKIPPEETYYNQALDFYLQGDLIKAEAALEQAQRLNPDFPKAEELLKVVREANSPKATRDAQENIAFLIQKAASFYLEDRAETAISMLQYIISLQPENVEAHNLLRAISKQRGEKVKTAAVSAAGLSFIDKMLYDALNYFYEEKYEMVIKTCQDVLTLEPNNALAHMRLGSAYYAIGQKDIAKEEWLKALEIEPDNPILLEFLRTIEAKAE